MASKYLEGGGGGGENWGKLTLGGQICGIVKNENHGALIPFPL